MSVISSIRSQFSPIHPQGYPFIGGFALVALVLLWLWPPLGWLAVVATLWCAYFFRDPPRVTPAREGILVAPADGRVSRVTDAVPPKELELGDRPLTRISIFMSVFNCHVNRSPLAGRIERIVYRAGAFVSADLDKASESNERNMFVIAAAGGTRIGVIQIAGLVARRIVPFVREGEMVAAGQRIGMIRFGSRVDVYLPEGARALVGEGQTAIAGETVLADLKASEPNRTFSIDVNTVVSARPQCRRWQARSEKAILPAWPWVTSPFGRSAAAAPAVPPYPGAHAGAESRHAARALRRADRHPHGVREPLCAGAGRYRVRRRARRHRRPSGAAVEGNFKDLARNSTACRISSISAWRRR